MTSQIYHEIRQTRPFRSLQEEVYVSLRLTSQLLDEPWARYLRRTARISPSQYNLLRILRGAGVEGRTMSEIADRMINRDPDATRLADRLVQRGLARRARDDADRRVVRLFITQGGLDLLATLDEVVDVFLEQALRGLDESQLVTLRDLLSAARQGRGAFPVGRAGVASG
jgi:DNA-binding MarR family transcriptional regulator